MNTTLKAGALATLAACGILAVPAAAQSQMTMRFTHVFAGNHWLWEHGGELFTREVEELSGGRITFEHYPAGQLGRETISIVTSGLAQIGIVAPSYESERLPLTTALELPGLHGNSCEGTARLAHLAVEGGALHEHEYSDLGVRVLYVNVLPPYALMTSRQAVGSLEDLAGLKIRANGHAMTMTASAIGAVPVPVTSAELYDSLARNTIDGVLLVVGSVTALGLDGVLNHIVEPTQLGGAATFVVIDEDVFQELDAETQDILMQAGRNTQSYLCDYLDRRETAERDQLVASGALRVTQLSEAEAARWNEALSGNADAWARDMENSGRPGNAVLEALRAAPTTF